MLLLNAISKDMEPQDLVRVLTLHLSRKKDGKGNGNPLQLSCLENPLDRGAWWTTVHRVAESDMTEAT